mmetsp:Transcript_13928/g.58600  ORF Transcript_13928/g.58600 Transcript_13928/m.58600 type:complete len:261 (+) Transcript_13928:918-1700(+)
MAPRPRAQRRRGEHLPDHQRSGVHVAHRLFRRRADALLQRARRGPRATRQTRVRRRVFHDPRARVVGFRRHLARERQMGASVHHGRKGRGAGREVARSLGGVHRVRRRALRRVRRHQGVRQAMGRRAGGPVRVLRGGHPPGVLPGVHQRHGRDGSGDRRHGRHRDPRGDHHRRRLAHGLAARGAARGGARRGEGGRRRARRRGEGRRNRERRETREFETRGESRRDAAPADRGGGAVRGGAAEGGARRGKGGADDRSRSS